MNDKPIYVTFGDKKIEKDTNPLKKENIKTSNYTILLIEQ